MKNTTLTKLGAILSGTFLSVSIASAAIYSQNFDNFVSGTNYYGGVVLYSYGYDADAAGAAYKALQYDQWGRNTTGGDFIDVDLGLPIDLEARPNNDGQNNAKLIGTFIDPALFTSGTGTYTFSVDYTGADAGASWVFLYKATGFDTSGNNDLVLDVANGGFTGFDPFYGTGTTVVTELARYGIANETVNETYSVDFAYTAGDAIGIAFGSYNTAGSYDNLSITAVPEPATFALFAGIATLGLIMYRRRQGQL